MQLSVSNGTLKLGQTTGLTITAGADESATITFEGGVAAAVSALEGLAYMPRTDFSGSDQLQFRVNDNGETGAGDAQETITTLDITVIENNSNPANTVPGDQTVDEDVPLVFSNVNANVLAVSDPDELTGSGSLTVSLQVTMGMLSLSGTSGLTFTSGDGTDDSSMVFSGTPGDLNTALEGLLFKLDTGTFGVATLTLSTTDAGDVGDGANPLNDTDSFDITVAAVNDAPNLTVPAAQTLLEDGSLVFDAASGNLISFVDDATETGSVVEVALTVASGSLKLSRTDGLAFSVGVDGEATFTFEATVDNALAALDGLTYAPNDHYNGADQLQVRIDDQGANGSGGAQETIASIDITVTAVNDIPVNAVPGAQTTDEDVPLVFSSNNYNALTVSDPDEDNAEGSLTVSLQVTSGTLTLSTITGLAFTTGDGTADSLMVFSGSPDRINTALEGMSFQFPENEFGTASLTLTTTDRGDSETNNSPLSDTDTFALTVLSVNDAPELNLPGNFSLDEDESFAFNTANDASITLSDDADISSILLLKVSVSEGMLTSEIVQGVTTEQEEDGTFTMNYSSTIVGINEFMEGLTFLPNPDQSGTVVVTFLVDDQGASGSGDAQQTSRAMILTFNAVNDAPIQTLPTEAIVVEDTPYTFSQANNNALVVTDVDAEVVETNLSVQHGTLSLATTADLVFTTGDGEQDAAITFQGTPEAITNALDGLLYEPDFNYDQDDALAIATSDLGNFGSGGVLQVSDSLILDIQPVDDVPLVLGGISNQALDDNATLKPMFSVRILAGDGDSADQSVQITLDDNSKGAFTPDSLTASGFSFSDDDGIYFNSAQPDVLTAGVQQLVFEPTPNRLGVGKTEGVAITIVVTGSEFTTKNFDSTLKVKSINDAPSISGLPESLAITDGVAANFFSGVSLEDPDTSRITVTVLLESSGTLGVWSGTESFTVGDDGTLTYMGLPGTAETLLKQLSFTAFGSSDRGFAPGSVSLSNLHVTVTDGVAHPVALSTQVEITLENAAPTSLSLTSSTAPENEQGFYRIGILEAEDGDHGDSHAFQIVQAPGGDLFSLAGGVLYSKSPFDYETATEYRLTIRATDLGGLSLEKEIVVRVVDDRSEDADLDGLTEAQEEDLYGSSDLLLDTDGDGHSDTNEAFAGSSLVDPISTPLGVLERAVALDGGWYDLAWLGTFEASSYPWLYLLGLGWVYPIESAENSLWMWLSDIGWVWTDADNFPYMYDAEEDIWIFWDSPNRIFYRYVSGEWEVQ